MKMLFISDFHIKPYDFTATKEYNKWQEEVYNKAINSIQRYIDEHSPEYIFCLGDVLDGSTIKNRELVYLNKLLNLKTGAKKYWISGNHNKIQNIASHVYLEDTISEVIESHGFTYVKDMLHIEEIDALLVNHSSIKKLETYRKKHKFLFSHIRWEAAYWTSEIEVANILNKISDKIILGDLHFKAELEKGKVIYTNAPIDTSFSASDSEPSILMYDNGEYKWLNTLEDSFRKVLVEYDSVKEFEDNFKSEKDNWYKVKINDVRANLKRIKPLNNVTYDLVNKELESKDEIEDIKEVISLTGKSIEQSFIEYTKANDERGCGDLIEAKISNMGEG